MRILVFGQSGQVAKELQRHPGVVTLSRDQADLTDPSVCAAVIQAHDADAIINAAAYTAVDNAEGDAVIAELINAKAPAAMAKAAAERGIPFVQISTDYVFDGAGTAPFSPNDATGPLGVYGATKLAGEHAVASAGGAHAILRTSWVFSAHGKNFVKTMLRLAEARDHLTIVGDQIGGPTPATDIASACVSIAKQLRSSPEKSGVYHFTGEADVSWADFAREIFRQSGKNVSVEDISTSSYPTPAQRPLNSRLNCSTTAQQFDISRPDWRQGLTQVLSALEEA